MALQPENSGLGEESFGFLIQLLSRRVETTMKKKLETVGVDIKLFANLIALYTRDGVNQRELGRRLDFPEYYTSRNVDLLVKEGWAERRPDPNSRRSFLIFLTKKGQQIASQLPDLTREANDEHLSEFTMSERKLLLKLLQKAVATTEESKDQ